jgi:hypothetical protein
MSESPNIPFARMNGNDLFDLEDSCTTTVGWGGLASIYAPPRSAGTVPSHKRAKKQNIQKALVVGKRQPAITGRKNGCTVEIIEIHPKAKTLKSFSRSVSTKKRHAVAKARRVRLASLLKAKIAGRRPETA